MDTNRAKEGEARPQADLVDEHDWATAAVSELVARLEREADFVAERWRLVLGMDE